MEILIMDEIWKDIKGYEGIYQVSNTGKVKSLERVIDRRKFGLQIQKDKILKPGDDSNGYLQVVLCKEGKMKTFKVHRLVAVTFIPNPDNLPCVNHKDENKTNNSVENLEWCTYEYNNMYGTRTERIGNKNKNGKCSKPVFQYSFNGKLIKEWPSVNEVERQTGYSIHSISSCCNGKLKQAYGYIWKYK